jgi:hypothetical protein
MHIMNERFYSKLFEVLHDKGTNNLWIMRETYVIVLKWGTLRISKLGELEGLRNEIVVLLGCYAALIGSSDISGQPVCPLKMWPVVCPETSVTTSRRCVTFQKSEDLIYIVAQAWKHDWQKLQRYNLLKVGSCDSSVHL